jgi:hypothetical protein
MRSLPGVPTIVGSAPKHWPTGGGEVVATGVRVEEAGVRSHAEAASSSDTASTAMRHEERRSDTERGFLRVGA